MGSSQTGIYTADKIIYVPNSIMLHFLTKNFIKILAQYLRKPNGKFTDRHLHGR